MSQFVIGNRTITNPDEITNKFNESFINIERLLYEQITSPHNSEEYLGDKPNVLFRFTLVNEDRISSIIKS